MTLAALLVSPRRTWPAILVAVGCAEGLNDIALGYAIAPTLWWSLANMVEPLIAALLVQRWQADGFDHVRRMVTFVAAVFVATGVGGAIGSIGTTAGVSTLPYHVIAGQWMIGDGLGMLTLVPFALLVMGRIPAHPLGSVEAWLAIGTVTVTAVAVFGAVGPDLVVAMAYLVLPPMVWAAVRHGVAGAAVAFFVTAQVANVANAFGRGPFGLMDLTPVQTFAQLQLFLLAVGLTVFLLASRTAESATFEDLADARQRLVAAVSHELRTPLTPIVGFSELLLRRADATDPELRSGLEAIHRNGRHLSALIDDLLQASRTARGAAAPEPEDIPLGAFVAALARDRADPGPVTVEGDARAHVDPTHLRQIVTNLLDNAWRHGRPPVGVVIGERDGHAAIEITDDGDGVPEDFVPHMFDPFAQAKEGRHRSRSGLGLGLPIARDLARVNGGDLVYQPEGDRTRFVLRLPAVRTSDEARHAAPGTTTSSRKAKR